MAIGITPKYSEEYPLNELTRVQFLAIASEAVQKNLLKISYISHNGLIADTDNGIFSRNFEITIKFEDEIVHLSSKSTGSEMVDWGKNKRIIKTLVEAIERLKSIKHLEDLDSQYLDLEKTFANDENDFLNLRAEKRGEQVKNFFSFFKPTQGFFATPILVDLNLLIFISMVIGGANMFLPDNDSLISWGANFRPLTLDGQWWRVLTSCFLHIGIVHLLLNMYALIYIGILLEPLLGRTKFITAYLFTGVFSSIASLWWNDFTISAGASGAIFGMYGLFLALLTTNFIEKTTRKALLTSISIFVGYNLLYGIKGGIDNAAHIGGLLSGLVIGYAFIPGLKRPGSKNLQYGTTTLLGFLVFLLSVYVFRVLPNDVGTYYNKMTEFTSMEEKALEVYRLPEDTPNEKLLSGISAKGIYYWNENIRLLNSFQNMDLPDEIKTRNRLLKEYCELRIKTYRLLYKAISENTNEYNQQLENYNNEVENKIKELNSGIK